MKYLINPESNGCLEKANMYYQKLVKDASSLAYFYGSHIDGIVCVKHIGSVLPMTLKTYKKFIKMSSDLNFTVTSPFLGNVRVKRYLNTQCPPSPDILGSTGPRTE